MSYEKREGGQPGGLAPFSGRSNVGRVDDGNLMAKAESRQVDKVSRVRVYIDGFNLYHAIACLTNQRLKWLNFWKLSESFLRHREVLDEVNLFTAVLTWNRDKQQRHVNFLAACRAVGVKVHEANFKRSYKTCAAYGRECKFFEEKQTDVAIAVKLVSDALSDSFDRAVLITADSDQIPAAKFITSLPDRKLSLLFPPGRKETARELGKIIPDSRELTPGHLLTCRLPRTVCTPSGKAVAWMPALYLSEPNSN